MHALAALQCVFKEVNVRSQQGKLLKNATLCGKRMSNQNV